MSDKNVIIYSTPTCHFCQMTKEFFKEHNVAYTDYNVAEDTAKKEEMIEKTGQMGVPVITVGTTDGGDEETVIGFDEERLKTLLSLS